MATPNASAPQSDLERLPCQHKPRVSNQKGLNVSLHKPGKLHNKSHKSIGGIKHARESGVR